MYAMTAALDYGIVEDDDGDGASVVCFCFGECARDDGIGLIEGNTAHNRHSRDMKK